MSPLENTKVTPRNDIVYLEEIIARKNERIALLEMVAEVVEKWATAIPADHEKEELWEMEDAIFSALRAAGYLGESK